MLENYDCLHLAFHDNLAQLVLISWKAYERPSAPSHTCSRGILILSSCELPPLSPPNPFSQRGQSGEPISPFFYLSVTFLLLSGLGRKPHPSAGWSRTNPQLILSFIILFGNVSWHLSKFETNHEKASFRRFYVLNLSLLILRSIPDHA